MSDFWRGIEFRLCPLGRGLAEVAAVMERGRLKHPDDDGLRQPAAFHIERARRHLDEMARGDRSEDHLSHAATRLLLALAQR
jgi:hypothetical protein